MYVRLQCVCLHWVMLMLGLLEATIMGPKTMPPVMAKACCSPMIRANRTGSGSLTAKKGGSLSVVSLRQYGHLGCKDTAQSVWAV